MSRAAPDALYRLLPAIVRLRDVEEGEPLRALMALLAREAAVIEDDIAQLLDDHFIETCAPWVVPYLGTLIGFQPLHAIARTAVSARADAANTIARRRRKGTAAVLEQLAFDVTGWPARAVEFFQHTATCQHTNVARPDRALAPDLHDPLRFERVGGAFEAFARSTDVRSIGRHRERAGVGGRHNLHNVGVFVWRLVAQRLSDVPATPVDDRRYLFDPLGAPLQLFARREADEPFTTSTTPLHVPGPISRRALAADLEAFYGRSSVGALRSVEISVDGVAIPATRIVACDLSDDGTGWHHTPHALLPAAALATIEGGSPLVPPANALVRLDPELGRFAFPEPEAGDVRVSFHLGSPASIGGGEYQRASTFASPTPDRPLLRYPAAAFASLQQTIDALPPTGGIVEIETNATITETLAIDVAAGANVELRAADGTRPLVRLGGDLVITTGAGAHLTLDGLVIAGGALRIVPDAAASPGAVTLRHATLVPGLSLRPDGQPTAPGAPSLVVEAPGVALTLVRCISGPLRMHDTTTASLTDCVVDAAAEATIDSPTGLALAGPTEEPAASVTLEATTVIGRIRVRSLPFVSDSIFFARASTAAEPPVLSLRRQAGCVRFTFVPQGSFTPARHRCQPDLAIDRAIAARVAVTGGSLDASQRALIARRVARWLVPSCTSLRYGAPAYLQLRDEAPAELRSGASDESEMGVYHHLYQPQREANLALRLHEHLRFGLEAGVFHET